MLAKVSYDQAVDYFDDMRERNIQPCVSVVVAVLQVRLCSAYFPHKGMLHQ